MKTEYLDKQIEFLEELKNDNEALPFELEQLQEYKDIKKQLTLTDVVPSVYVVTETDNYGRQLFRDVFLDKEQAKEYLAMDNLKEDNINEINKIEFD